MSYFRAGNCFGYKFSPWRGVLLITLECFSFCSRPKYTASWQSTFPFVFSSPIQQQPLKASPDNSILISLFYSLDRLKNSLERAKMESMRVCGTPWFLTQKKPTCLQAQRIILAVYLVSPAASLKGARSMTGMVASIMSKIIFCRLSKYSQKTLQQIGLSENRESLCIKLSPFSKSSSDFDHCLRIPQVRTHSSDLFCFKEIIIPMQASEDSAILNGDRLQGLFISIGLPFDFLDNLQTADDLSEHHVLAVESQKWTKSNEKLGVVGVGSLVSHAQQVGLVMLELEVLVLEGHPID